MSVRAMNMPRFFLSTVRSRNSSAPKAMRLAAPAERRGLARGTLDGLAVAISRAAPFPSG